MSKIKNIAFLLLLIGIVVVSGCVSQGASTTSGKSQAEPAIGIGQAATVGTFNISVAGRGSGALINKYDSQASLQGNRIILYVNLINNGKSSTYLNSRDFKLIDEQGRKFDSLNDEWMTAEDYANYIGNGFNAFSDKLQPGINYYIGLIFDVSENEQKFAMRFCNAGTCKNFMM